MACTGIAAQEPPPASQPPAALALPDMAGQPQSLENYRGRIVVLNFWATWCVPCREEMPLLEKFHREYAARGVVVIGASADDEKTQKHIAPFLKKAGVTFPIWTGATTQHMESLELGAALPATAILGRDGRILLRILGPLHEENLRARIEWMLGDRSAPMPEAILDTFKQAQDHTGHSHAKNQPKDEHKGEEEHGHGGVGIEGASTVPS